MAIRAFLCRWTEAPNGSDIEVTDPISTYLTDVSLSDRATVLLSYFGRRSGNARPDKLFMLKLVRGNLTAAEWTALGALQGVRMAPAFAFDRTIASVPNSVRNQVFAVLDELGIARTVWTGAATLGGFLRNLLAELDPGNVSFGPYENEPGDWA